MWLCSAARWLLVRRAPVRTRAPIPAAGAASPFDDSNVRLAYFRERARVLGAYVRCIMSARVERATFALLDTVCSLPMPPLQIGLSGDLETRLVSMDAAHEALFAPSLGSSTAAPSFFPAHSSYRELDSQSNGTSIRPLTPLPLGKELFSFVGAPNSVEIRYFQWHRSVAYWRELEHQRFKTSFARVG